MNEKFKNIVDRMPVLLQSLQEKSPILKKNIGINDVPEKGVYVFFENNKPIYVGRSNRMKERLKEHSQKSADQYSATLAIRMAKKEFPTKYKKMTTKQLRGNRDFEKLFEAAKERIAQAEIRFIEITEQAEQAMFEMYAILILDTEFNDFNTH